MSRQSTAILALALAVILLAGVVWRLNTKVDDLESRESDRAGILPVATGSDPYADQILRAELDSLRRDVEGMR